ncbi:MAG: DnaJ domain-containing protein [Caulobacteraceae bacterium]
MTDPKGYYRALGVVARSSREEIAQVYLQLQDERRAEEASDPEAPARFKSIDEAYHILGEPDRRAIYDAQCISHDLATRISAAAKPIRCQICNQVTAQPRYLVFWGIISKLYSASRRPTQGIFCAACARKVSWIATAGAALLGWWSPWGLAWTPVYGLRNVFGGQKPRGLESELAWTNAKAFHKAGNVALASALAGRVAALKGPHSEEARRFQETLLKNGGPGPQKLVDPWRVRPLDLIGRSLLLFLAPMLLVAVVGAVVLRMAGNPRPGRGPGSVAEVARSSGVPPQIQGPCVVRPLSDADHSSGNCRDVDAVANASDSPDAAADAQDESANLSLGEASHTPTIAPPPTLQRPSSLDGAE